MNKIELPSITSVTTWEDIFNAYNRNFNEIYQIINTNGFVSASFTANKSNIKDTSVILESECAKIFDNEKDVLIVFKNNVLQIGIKQELIETTSDWDYYVAYSSTLNQHYLVFQNSLSDSDSIKYIVLSGIDLTGDIQDHVKYIESVKKSAEDLQKNIDVSRSDFNTEWSKIISVCNWIINNMEATPSGDYVVVGDRNDAIAVRETEWKQETSPNNAIKKKVVLDVFIDSTTNKLRKKCQYEFIDTSGLLYKVSDVFYEDIADIEVHNHNLPN